MDIMIPKGLLNKENIKNKQIPKHRPLKLFTKNSNFLLKIKTLQDTKIEGCHVPQSSISTILFYC